MAGINKISSLIMALIMMTALLAGCSNTGKKPDKFILIAHRGGVVDDSLSENSIKGLEEAIRRGYTHVEVDARITSDGVVVCYHDENLARETGVNKNISEFTLAELQQIVLTKSQEPIPTFDEFCRRCSGRIDVMIDPKGAAEKYMEAYAVQIESALTKHHLLENALIITNRMPSRTQDKVADWFLGKSKTAWRYNLLKTQILAQARPGAGKYHFVFNSPKDFTKEMIEGFHKMDLKVIASVNLAHYWAGDPVQLGLADIQKMFDWGVDGLQIDSRYDSLVFARIRTAK